MNKKNNSCEMFKLLQVKAEKENEQNKLNLLYCDIIKENICNIPQPLIYQKHLSERSVFT